MNLKNWFLYIMYIFIAKTHKIIFKKLYCKWYNVIWLFFSHLTKNKLLRQWNVSPVKYKKRVYFD